jgi:hypothetical protein
MVLLMEESKISASVVHLSNVPKHQNLMVFFASSSGLLNLDTSLPRPG